MNTITVSEINAYVKAYLEKNPLLGHLYIRGEISNFKHHSSGHCYMSLKDETSVIKAVMFKYAAASLEFEPENGMKVIVNARLSAYERDGIYQLYINEMQPDGLGALHIKFEQLKARLEQEGLFDSRFKKSIPRFPGKIGIVTSPTGAALRDILNILKRRYPYAEIFVYPALVQGEGAYKTIIKGIEYFTANPVDTIIIGRGGGSVEDLWNFNEEALARAIFACPIPLISAVGHETDFCISDFTADLRAPTPSAAAELCVPSAEEIKKYILTAKSRLYAGVINNFKRCEAAAARLSESRILKYPQAMLENKMFAAASLGEQLKNRYERLLAEKREKFLKAAAGLDALSPLKVLSRGYAFVESESGGVVEGITGLSGGDKLNLNFTDGTALCEILELRGDDNEQL